MSKKDKNTEKEANSKETESKRKDDAVGSETENKADQTDEAAEKNPQESASADSEKKQSAGNSDINDKFLRLAADFDNYKKRAKAEKEALYSMCVCDTVAKFIPIFDDLERAVIMASDDVSPVKKGVEQVLAKVDSAFKALNIEPFGEKGDVFDANLHEAVMQCQSDEYDDGKIAEVFQRGFRMTTNDKIIRYAKVKVVSK